MTLKDPYPLFVGHAIYYDEYLRKGTIYRHSFNGILIGPYIRPTQQCRFEWSRVTMQNIQWQEASSGLSATAELLVLIGHGMVRGKSRPRAARYGMVWRGLGGLRPRPRPVPSSVCEMSTSPTAHHQRPVYQLHIVSCGTIITCAHWRVKTHVSRLQMRWSWKLFWTRGQAATHTQVPLTRLSSTW